MGNGADFGEFHLHLFNMFSISNQFQSRMFDSSSICNWYGSSNESHLSYHFAVLQRRLGQDMIRNRSDYSKIPIIRTGTYASLAVHTMYCKNCPMFGTYSRSFRVGTINNRS